jgi:hypothetical protein
MKEAKAGMATLKSPFVYDVIDEQGYLYIPAALKNINKMQTTFLLPDYDEYGISYKNRSALFNPKSKPIVNVGGNATSYHMIILDGQ